MAAQRAPSSTPSVSRSKAARPQINLNDSELGIGIWQGKAVFVNDSAGSSSPLDNAPTRTNNGSASSPISVASSSPPSPPITRPRAVARYTSPLPRTAFTPPRTTEALSEKGPNKQLVHPFFTRQRPVPPTPTKPAFVAHYSSTEAESESSQSASQSSKTSSTSWLSQRSLEAYIEEEIASMTKRVVKVKLEGSVKGEPKISETGARLPLVKARSLPVKISAAQALGESQSATLPAFQPPKAYNHKLENQVQPDLPYFTYKTYPRPPSIVYTRSIQEANDLVGCLKGQIIGFDIEWPVQCTKTWDKVLGKYVFRQAATALVQLCDDRMVILYHLKQGTDLPTKIVDLIQDQAIYKLGVNCKGDGQKLLRDFPKQFPVDKGPASLLELSRMAKAVDSERAGSGERMIQLSTLCRGYLQCELEKDPEVRKSDWSKELNQRQREYAANDVWVAIQLFSTYKRIAQSRNIQLDFDSYCTTLNRSFPDLAGSDSGISPSDKPSVKGDATVTSLFGVTKILPGAE